MSHGYKAASYEKSNPSAIHFLDHHLKLRATKTADQGGGWYLWNLRGLNQDHFLVEFDNIW